MLVEQPARRPTVVDILTKVHRLRGTRPDREYVSTGRRYQDKLRTSFTHYDMDLLCRQILPCKSARPKLIGRRHRLLQLLPQRETCSTSARRKMLLAIEHLRAAARPISLRPYSHKDEDVPQRHLEPMCPVRTVNLWLTSLCQLSPYRVSEYRSREMGSKRPLPNQTWPATSNALPRISGIPLRPKLG
jgi:hypothetical protein